MTILQAIILAIVEGLTEFLPISSTGHLTVAASLMGIAQHPYTKMFNIAIQFGAILSVVVLYWRRFIPNKTATETLKFYLKLLIAFIPAAIIGKLASEKIDELLESPVTVAYAFIAGGFVLLFIDRLFRRTEKTGSEEPTNIQSFIIGLFQTIAMVPGVSRSAATIIGGLSQKLNRRAAAEFSFFLAVPTLFAATVYKIFKFYKTEGGFSHDDLGILILGNVVAFLVAAIAIKAFINYLSRHGFRIFGFYRIIAGVIILWLYYEGIISQVV